MVNREINRETVYWAILRDMWLRTEVSSVMPAFFTVRTIQEFTTLDKQA